MKNSCLFTLLLILNTLCAQPALISWEVKEGNKGEDFFTKSIQLSNGNLAVIGNLSSPDGLNSNPTHFSPNVISLVSI
jgi:hypothetical protein